MRPLRWAALCLLLTTSSALADLDQHRDVDRALTLLTEGSDARTRGDAARWLATHGPDSIVMPRLLDALEREPAADVLGPLVHAVARRAGREHDARLIRIAPAIRSPFRGVLVVAIAQLETEASDAYLAEELAALGTVDIEVAESAVMLGTSNGAHRVSLVALARGRRDAVVPALLLESAPPRMAPVEVLVALADERARSLFVSLLDDPALGPLALEGLAALGPESRTADAIRARIAGAPTPLLARALFAADPNARELQAWRTEGSSEVQQALRALWIARAPSRLSPEEARAHFAEDARAWSMALTTPNADAREAYAALAGDDAVPLAAREAIFDAQRLLAETDASLCTQITTHFEGTRALVASARLARTCHTQFNVPSSLAPPAQLYLRALAGEDVRASLRQAWGTATDMERRDLAHAWWVSREADEALASAWEQEPNDDVRDVLSLAVVRHRITVQTSLLAQRIDMPRTRLASLLVARVQPALSFPLRPRVLAALHDEASLHRAAALHTLAAFEPAAALQPFACVALRGDEAERAAARVVLASEARCLREEVRVDETLRTPRTLTTPREVVVHVEGDAQPTLVFVGADASLGLVRPTSLGVVVFPDVRAAMRVSPTL